MTGGSPIHVRMNETPPPPPPEALLIDLSPFLACRRVTLPSTLALSL